MDKVNLILMNSDHDILARLSVDAGGNVRILPELPGQEPRN
jgi:hypothetical protein